MFENFALKCPEFDKANEGFSYFSRFPLSRHLNKIFQILTLTFFSLKHKKYGYLIYAAGLILLTSKLMRVILKMTQYFPLSQFKISKRLITFSIYLQVINL